MEIIGSIPHISFIFITLEKHKNIFTKMYINCDLCNKEIEVVLIFQRVRWTSHSHLFELFITHSCYWRARLLDVSACMHPIQAKPIKSSVLGNLKLELMIKLRVGQSFSLAHIYFSIKAARTNLQRKEIKLARRKGGTRAL